ncbi:MAG: inner membrane-spanning protein YciB [Paracoccus sp. (in: a-proteobacteria)]|uniref:inner membrane-spanning protein YciB n=1 Tax=unclassified Paracoccus (in: a-proteobacteria) TaxID=2688777 RepID=UPI000C67EBE3|nr:intracellular septation protein A [Paracoccus sp. (in: a-proteobacteria)]MBA48811.1 intracellular septation protein A [Paracoccus sp. (in: a-proteobacteria)]HIC67465.1 septation protein IspZ [Paracoccus sp. (in: a-proteobacteria)]
MKEPNPLVKSALELGPLLLFFGVFMWNRGGTVSLWGQDYTALVFATLIFIPVLAIATLIQWRLSGRLAPMQVVTLVLVVIFGGLSVWLNDPRFFKMKPTIIYLLFAAILGYSLVARRNWLQAVLSEALPMDALGWRKLTMRMMLLFLGLALANEFVWRMMSETSWVYFKTFGLPLILFVFLIANAGLYRAHAVESEKDDEQG